MDKIECSKYTENLYNFKEIGKQDPEAPAFGYVDAWLYLGSERVVVIDTLENAPGLYEEVRKITQLPIDVLITHGHLDHTGIALEEFVEKGCAVYMDCKDLSILPPYVKPEWFTDIKDGDTFSLGDRKLEAISCAGHTLGSMVFLDRENGMMFSGDTLGSCRIWLQLPHSAALSDCKKNLLRLMECTQDVEDMKIYPGHVWQTVYMPLKKEYLNDLLQCMEEILNGTAVTRQDSFELEGMKLDYEIASHGTMEELCFDPKNL